MKNHLMTFRKGSAASTGLFLSLMFAPLGVQGDTIYPLSNPSFESPGLSVSNDWYAGVDGWGTAGAGAGSLGTTYDLSGLETYPTTDGNQTFWGATDDFHIFQQTGTVAPDTRYLFKVDVYPLTTGTSRASLFIEETDTWTAPFAEKNYHPTWNESLEDFDLPAGEWTTVTIGFNSSDFASFNGFNFRVRLHGYHVALDNAQLVSTNTINNYYISSSTGDDNNDGTSPSTPWASFVKLSDREILPGESINLARGDTFTDEMNVRGKGTAQDPILVTPYGTGDRPKWIRGDKEFGRCIVWNNPSHVHFDSLDMQTSKVGIFLRYEWTDPLGNFDVRIDNCHFEDMDDVTIDPSKHNYEMAYSSGVFMGGQAWNSSEMVTFLDGLTITNCTAIRAGHIFSQGYWYPQLYKSRLKNLIIEDSFAGSCMYGAFTLLNVDGGHARRVRAVGSGGIDVWSGLSLGMIQASKNFTIEDCEFSYADRAQSADGVGFDFEGSTDNCIFRNNTIHNNDGAGLLILNTQGDHTNLTVTGNTFYNNSRDPWIDNGNAVVQGHYGNSTGTITDNVMYRGTTEIDVPIPFFSNGDWSNFTMSNNTQAEFETVNEKRWWDFETNGDFEGWSNFVDWFNAAVTGGNLVGDSGADAFAHSDSTWVNTNLYPYAWVRMSQTVGNFAQLYFITATDSVWDQTKSVTFPITSDGSMQDYFVDLDALSTTNGVITKVRLDPADASGSSIAVDHVRMTDSTDPAQSAPLPPYEWGEQIILNSVASEDGYVTESGNDTGVGGSANSTGTSLRIGDSIQNQAHRAILSFDTSVLPDDAVITRAQIGISRTQYVGDNIPIGVADPWTGFQKVDVASGYFGTSPALEASDFEAPGTAEDVAQIAWPAYGDGYTAYARLEEADLGLINLTGKTQFRVHYPLATDDNDDSSDDYVAYATAEHGTPSWRPQLIIRYVGGAIETPPSLATADFSSNASSTNGSYVDTHISDNVAEVLTESVSGGGPPSNRFSQLDHVWTFDVPAGTSHAFHLEAWRDANSEGDDFTFSWSSDNSSYTPMLTVNKSSDDNVIDSYLFPGSISGTIYVKVSDTDQSGGNQSLDSVYVDYMAITSEGGSGGDTTPPASPTNLVATGGDGEVALDWDDNSEPDLASYNVYRSLTSGSGYGLLAQSVTLSAYTDTTVTNGTTYYYAVAAVDTSQNEGLIGNEASATPESGPDTTPPSIVTGVVATGGDGEVVLDWADNPESDIASYKVYRSLTSTNGYTLLASGIVPSNYTDTNVTNGTTYYYRISAVDTSSNEGIASDEEFATPQSSGAATTMSVSSIVPSLVDAGQGKKRGRATITVLDNNGAPVNGVTVTATFSGTYSETVVQTTNSSGVAVLDTSATAKGGISFTVCVDSVTGGSLTYDSASNTETCDSN